MYAAGGAEAAPGNATGKSAELNLPFQAIEGKEEAAKEALQGFGKREARISQTKIRADVLLSLGAWSVAELVLLEPLYSEMAVVENASEQELVKP